jgi:hypothetical protein
MNFNPYQPPTHRPTIAISATTGARLTVLSWHVFAYVGLSILALGLDAGVIAGLIDGPNGLFVRWAACVVGIIWLARQWKVLPPAHRIVGGQLRTPGAAAFSHFLPFYNLYWMFTVQKSLCDGLDAGLDAAGLPRSAPTTLALVCPAVQLLGGLSMNGLRDSFAFLVVAAAQSGLWFVYMLRVASVSSRVAARWGIPG